MTTFVPPELFLSKLKEGKDKGMSKTELEAWWDSYKSVISPELQAEVEPRVREII